MKYAIFGAAGAVGKELAKLLAAENQNFRVVGRREAELKMAFSQLEPYVEYCAADLMKPEDAARAARDVETIFYLVGAPYNQFHLHPLLSGIVTAAAAAAQVKKFVHVSTLYPYGRARTPLISEEHPREPHTYKGKMRKEQEDIVLAAHGKNGMQVTVLCPPDFFGGDSDLNLVQSIFMGALANKTADVLGPIDTPHEFIFVPDLARALLALSRETKAYGRRWNIAGSGRITMREFANKVYSSRGLKPRMRVAGKNILRVMGFFNPILKEFVEMHYLIQEPLFVDDRALMQLLPQLARTSYDQGIALTLERMGDVRSKL